MCKPMINLTLLVYFELWVTGSVQHPPRLLTDFHDISNFFHNISTLFEKFSLFFSIHKKNRPKTAVLVVGADTSFSQVKGNTDCVALNLAEGTMTTFPEQAHTFQQFSVS